MSKAQETLGKRRWKYFKNQRHGKSTVRWYTLYMTGKLVIVGIDISVLQFDIEVWQNVLVIPVLLEFWW